MKIELVPPVIAWPEDTTKINDQKHKIPPFRKYNNKPDKVKIDIIPNYRKTGSEEKITWVWAPEYVWGETIVDKNKFNEFNTEIAKLKNKPKIKLILNFSKIWLDWAKKAATEQWGLMWLSHQKEHIEKTISNITQKLQNLVNNINLTDQKRDKIIDEIFTEMLKTENNDEDIIDNIEEIKQLFSWVTEKNYVEKLANLLELSAGGFRDWNTEKSKEISRDIIIH